MEQEIIERMKQALGQVREGFASIRLKVSRRIGGGPVKVSYEGYTFNAGFVSAPLSELPAALNGCTPAMRRLKEAADLRARAEKLESEAAALERGAA